MADEPGAVDAKESPDDSWRVVRMRVTAYCPCSKCCGAYSDGITACNHHIQNGDRFVAADKRYPFGTEMIIPGYNQSNPVQVKDRGGAIKNDKLDVFFNTHEEALVWGVQYLDVLVKVQ
ncbi:MAG: 3D domain-containing protein [Planctomycetota bacterium]